MKDPLVRFGVAIEASLLRELDTLAKERGCTRSELFRDLGRAAVGRAKVPKGVEAVGALTLVYNHHVRDLSERLTEVQHQLGQGVRSAMHVHLSHDLCLEVVVMQGRSDRLQAVADRILAMRGVKQGGIEMITALDEHARRGGGHHDDHVHDPRPGHTHGAHEHAHAHAHAEPEGTRGSRRKGGRRSQAPRRR